VYYANLGAGEGGGDGYKQTNNGLGNIVARNNIIRASRYVFEGGCDNQCSLDYEALYTVDSGRFIEYSGTRYWDLADWCDSTGNGCNSIEIDAVGQWASPGSGNFALKSGSPLVDAGAVIPGFNDAGSAWAYRGAAPDIGAVER
jgi:hypothetical protein